MSKKNENIISECKAWQEKYIMECWAFTDEEERIVYFNNDGTIVYQRGSEKDGNKKETVIKLEQIEKVMMTKPTKFKRREITICLKEDSLYGSAYYFVNIPQDQETFIELFLIPWFKRNNIEIRNI